MRKVFTLTFVCFLSAICAGATKAQERPIDFSSRGANVLGAPGAQSLSLPSQAAPAAVVASFLRSRGFLPETVASLVVKKAGRVSRTGITHLRFAQEVEGLTVYGTYVKAAVNDDGELVHLIENLATPSSGRLMPTAIGVAEQHLVASPRRPGRQGVGRRHRLGLLTWVDRRVLAFQRD